MLSLFHCIFSALTAVWCKEWLLWGFVLCCQSEGSSEMVSLAASSFSKLFMACAVTQAMRKLGKGKRRMRLILLMLLTPCCPLNCPLPCSKSGTNYLQGFIKACVGILYIPSQQLLRHYHNLGYQRLSRVTRAQFLHPNILHKGLTVSAT